MALKDDAAPPDEKPTAGVSPSPPATSTQELMPVWVAPAYLAGLVLVFLGERVLSTLDSGRWAFTALGGLLVVAATTMRFLPRYRTAGERAGIERLLAVLSVVGVVALGLYAATTDGGAERLGLASLETEARERWLGILTIAWIALLGLSVVPMLFAEGALWPMRRAERPEGRRVRAATVSGLSLVIAALYGALFVYAADGADIKADYSYFKTSAASDSTKNVAKALSEPVDVVAFFPEVNEVRTEVERYLRDVAAATPNLKLEVADRLLIPKRARELRATQDGVIVLARGTVTESLNIGTEERNARPKLKTLDRDFQEKLLKLVRSRRTVYLTVGHGELNDVGTFGDEGDRKVSILRTLLQKQNYLIKDLGLGQGLGNDVPEDADVVMILGPSEPFAAEELGALRRYLDRGGKLLMALDPEVVRQGAEAELAPTPAPNGGDAGALPDPAPPAMAPALAGHAELAELVGLAYSPVLLANEKSHVRRRFNDSDRTLLVTNRFSSHASVSTLSRNSARAVVVTFGAGSLERASGATQTVDFALRSMAGTFQDANRNYRADPDEKPSTFNLAAAVSAKAKNPPAAKPDPDAKKDEKKPPTDELRAFVLADADAFTDVVLSNVLGNQVLLLDALRWLGGEESFAGEVNTEEDVRLEHTKQKDAIWFYATIFGAPALILGLGLFGVRRARRTGKKGERT
ncbi:MAG: Gldg family protein [Polyangiaceae bacterium]|nr:Gldg family protein [Polyangiaceae bacterium]